ncbi:MAG: hypothetical protein JSV63_02400 [Candidatus Aenigmatarchaeota archaeon]|nr:MAG: hypothetical protein JSV63_02400 [Candidatus Aenigmarchaeota archaeon]
MSARHGYGKSKKHAAHENQAKHAHLVPQKKLHDIEILAALIAVIIIGIVIIVNFYPAKEVITEEPNVTEQEELAPQDCEYLLPPEECDDLTLKDRALTEENPEICELIETETIRDHCRRYFR